MGKQMQRLGDVIANRMTSTARANSSPALELGTINSDLSLKVDSLKGNIRPSDYMVDLRLTHTDYKTDIENDGNGHTHTGGDHTHSGGQHKHRIPDVFRKLKAGDRVLVAWVGNEPIIVAIVVAGTT